MANPANLRDVTYERYEFHTDENTVHTGTLLTFVYDIPYFAACGVFPPLHIANQIFSRGTAGGGMSQGTEWEPFTLSGGGHAALVEAVKQTPVSEIKPYARCAFLPMKFDNAFDDIAEWAAWVEAVCKKHREDWHAALKKAGFGLNS
jgi:hypothetical protein